MQKEIYILKGIPGEDYRAFRDRILSVSEKILGEARPDSLKVTLTVRKPPVLSVIPFRREKTAVFSFTGRRAGAQVGMPAAVSAAPGVRGGYHVEEAVPLACEKTWPDGEPTPGACLLTLFHRKPGLDREAFLQKWHGGHTPLSLRIHPLWNYNRNVVLKALSEDSPWYDGIVEEQFRSAGDLLNPLKFFGPPIQVPRHMYRVYRDTRSFIDMKRIETYLATEIHIKSPP